MAQYISTRMQDEAANLKDLKNKTRQVAMKKDNLQQLAAYKMQLASDAATAAKGAGDIFSTASF